MTKAIGEELGRIGNPSTRAIVGELSRTAGVQGTPAVVFLIRRMSYHLGLGGTPTPPSSLHGMTGWVERRAWEVLEENRHRLPALREDTCPKPIR